MLNAKNFGLAGGILWGAAMLLLTWLALLTGYAMGLLEAISSLYPGYSITWLGGIIGAVYGFVDAGIGFFVFAWIYNKLEK